MACRRAAVTNPSSNRFVPYPQPQQSPFSTVASVRPPTTTSTTSSSSVQLQPSVACRGNNGAAVGGGGAGLSSQTKCENALPRMLASPVPSSFSACSPPVDEQPIHSSSSSNQNASSTACAFGFVPQPIAARRLYSELQNLNKSPVANCRAYPSSDNIFQWHAVVLGPDGTVYEGGTFFVELNFAGNYPFVPPEVLFLTRIYHCNITNQGKVCLEVVSKSGWRPCLDVATILQSLVSLLYVCNPHSPLVPSIAEQFMKEPEEFKRTAKIWTQRFAH